jgi:hypothetical protein
VKLLYWLGFVIVCLAVGVGVYMLMPRTHTVVIESASQPPLEWDSPLKIEAPAAARVGEQIVTISHRCQNTGIAIETEVSVFFQSRDKKQLIPYTLPVGVSPAGTGPVFYGVIQPGCVDGRGRFTIPEYVPLGEWRLLGQVCFGGVVLEVPRTCAGWESEHFMVIGEALD